jgi:hypothetical protein
MKRRSLLGSSGPRRRRLWRLFAGAAAIVFTCIQVAAQPPDLPTDENGIERALRRAEKDLARGDYPAAGEAAREILAQSYPQGDLRARALTVLGKVLFFNSRTTFKHDVPPGEIVDGRRQVAEEHRVEWEARSDGMRQAEQALRDAIRLGGPSSREARHYLAQVLYTMRRHDEAAAELDAYFAASDIPTARETERRAILLRGCLEYLRSEPTLHGKDRATAREIAPPKRASSPAPQYSEAARNARLQGYVAVELIIEETGKVRCARPLMGLPLGLTESAVDALWQWTWKPAEVEGRPVAIYFQLTSDFRLQ